jgi:hypothetical protein
MINIPAFAIQLPAFHSRRQRKTGTDNQSSGRLNGNFTTNALDDWPKNPEELGKLSIVSRLLRYAEWFMMLAPTLFIGKFLYVGSMSAKDSLTSLYRPGHCNYVCQR